MKTKKIIIYISALMILASCSSSFNSGELIGVKNIPWSEPTPHNMKLIKGGSYELGQSEKDTVFGINPDTKKVSVESFWIDETEITNGQYKQFIKWVCDSIIREKLADPAYGGNDDYIITEDRNGDPISPVINWDIPVPSTKRATEEELSALNYFQKKDEITGRTKIKTNLIRYKYEWFDYEAAAKRENQIDPAKRDRNTDNPVNNNQIMITKDTAYISEEGNVVNTSITRPLSSEFDFLNTYIIEIYPDTTCWINDFPNSNNEEYAINYFSHPAYNAFPVVGISWDQAVAFCHWRTEMLNARISRPQNKAMRYRLPTEAEWEYAARGKQEKGRFPWQGDNVQTKRGCYFANFKPGKGDYYDDGNLIPAKVSSYPPNEYGLYDMSGNVAEWTSTNWSESGYQDMNEINPSLNKHVTHNEAYINKQKVVRGGSWKDAARFITVSSRAHEYENESRSYIGFRCVRSFIGSTRK